VILLVIFVANAMPREAQFLPSRLEIGEKSVAKL